MDLMQKNSHKEEQFSQKQASHQMFAQISQGERRKKPQLIRINADNQTKQFLCKFWILFLVFIVALAIISTTLPNAFIDILNDQQLKGTSLKGCLNPSRFNNSSLECQNFSITNPFLGFISRNLQARNQFILISLYIQMINVNIATNINQNVTYTVYDLKQKNSGNGTMFFIDHMHQHETSAFKLSSNSATKLYANDGSTVIGFVKLVGVARDLDSENLYLQMQFNDYATLNSSQTQFNNVASIYLTGQKVNPKFTNFTIGIRYFYFILAIIALFLYIRNLRSQSQKIRTTQQKFIKILAILLLFFNDPLYPITILKPNMFSSFLSTVFVITFIVFLMFLWLVFTDRIYQQVENHQESYRKLKIAYSIVFQILLVTLYMLYASYSLNDHPIVPAYDLQTGKYLAIEIICAIWGISGIIYIVTQFIRSCCKQGNLLWRHEMFIVYSILYIFAMFIFFLANNSLGSFSYNGSSILFLYSLMNMYCWYLMYMFSPSSDAPSSFSPQRKSEQGMSQIQGTIQLNEININLDRLSEHHQSSSLKNIQSQQKYRTKQNNNANFYKQQVQQDNKGFQIVQSQFSQQPHHIIDQNLQSNKKIEQVDFFNEKKNDQMNEIKQVKTRQENLMQLNNQNENKNAQNKKNKDQKKEQQIQSDFGTFQLQ